LVGDLQFPGASQTVWLRWFVGHPMTVTVAFMVLWGWQ
jgi:hypothetical protein